MHSGTNFILPRQPLIISSRLSRQKPTQTPLHYSASYLPDFTIAGAIRSHGDPVEPPQSAPIRHHSNEDEVVEVAEGGGRGGHHRRSDDKRCAVCGDHAVGYNFGAIACESCKAFFRRNALRAAVSHVSFLVACIWLQFLVYGIICFCKCPF